MSVPFVQGHFLDLGLLARAGEERAPLDGHRAVRTVFPQFADPVNLNVAEAMVEVLLSRNLNHDLIAAHEP